MENYCFYSDLPSPMAYMQKAKDSYIALSLIDIDRVIEMAWEDRTSFDAIKLQFGLNESQVKALMKKNLKIQIIIHILIIIMKKKIGSLFKESVLQIFQKKDG